MAQLSVVSQEIRCDPGSGEDRTWRGEPGRVSACASSCAAFACPDRSRTRARRTPGSAPRSCPPTEVAAARPRARAFDSPMAIACLVERAPCFPSRMWSIFSRTNSPAAVVGALPPRRSS